MDTSWNVGDLVKLKSGSPVMVVNRIGLDDGMVEVAWFDMSTYQSIAGGACAEYREYHTMEFGANALKKAAQ